MFKKYLLLNAEEIINTVKQEVDEGSLDYDSEKALHLLLENRKHIKQFCEEQSGHENA